VHGNGANSIIKAKSMTKELKKAFSHYTDIVALRLSKSRGESRVNRPLKLVRNAVWLLDETERLEDESEFRHLVGETYSAFLPQDRKDTKGFDTKNLWRNAIRNFFRRSCYYIDVFEGKTPDLDTIFNVYNQAFKKRETRIRYLAPMELVYFAQKFMDFETFQIRKFTSDELEDIFSNRVNQVFYPHASALLRCRCIDFEIPE